MLAVQPEQEETLPVVEPVVLLQPTVPTALVVPAVPVVMAAPRALLEPLGPMELLVLALLLETPWAPLPPVATSLEPPLDLELAAPAALTQVSLTSPSLSGSSPTPYEPVNPPSLT